ncbi:MAG: PAS domain S-box protein [Methanosarcinaceae archaeon]|nr:PAS domain S-box protein [Methanosarcinaceae archaeon]
MGNELQKRGYTISNYLADSSINPILTEDVIRLQQLIESTKNTQNDIVYVFILDENGEVIVHTFENGFPVALKNVNPANGEESDKLLDIENEYVRDIAHPILGGRIGEAHVGLSETSIRATVSRSIRNKIIITASLVFIGILLSFATGTIICKPLLELKNSAEDFGKGNLDSRVRVRRHDEIGELAESFNNMAEEVKILVQEKEINRQNILETKDYLDAIISASHDGIFVLDSEGKFEFINDAVRDISGYDESDLIGENFKSFIPNDYKVFMNSRWQEAQKGMEKAYETKIMAKDGSLKDLIVDHRSIEVHGERKYAAVIKDITEIKKIDEMKSNIISNISHELRTPITIMRGFIEVAMDEIDTSKRVKYLNKSLKALDRQNQMIEDLLEVSIAEKEKFIFNYETVDLEDVIDTTVKNVIPKAERYDIEIRTDLEKNLNAKADRTYLVYALTKLIDNAVKFNKKGGNVAITARHTDGFIKVCVEDTGIGISKGNMRKVFDKFYQVDATTTRKYGGSGLGLSIAKHLIEEQGGEIWVESELGKGSIFCFTVPKAH